MSYNTKINIYRISTISLLLVLIFTLFNFASNLEKEDLDYTEKVNRNYNVYSIPTPTEIYFAGERVPVEDFDIYERLDREIHVNTYYHSNTFLLMKRANQWFPVIEEILEKNDIPNDFKYLALIESGLQNVVSPAGATGYWQFMESTGKEYGLEINKDVDERYHVEKSTEAACMYFKKAYEKFGSWSLVAGSYNVGMGRIEAELKRQKTDTYYNLLLNEETKRYVFRILAIKEIFENPENFGFNIRKKDLYPPLKTQLIRLDSSVTDFADFAHNYSISYKTLKYFNPWLRQGSLENPSRKSYYLKLPAQTSLMPTKD